MHKTLMNIRLALSIIALTSLLEGCNDDAEVKPGIVSFDSEEISINEGGGPQIIHLLLNKPARNNGTVIISTSPTDASTYITVPTEVEITEGSTTAEIVVTPVYSLATHGQHVITLNLAGATDGFKIGVKSSVTVTIVPQQFDVTVNGETYIGKTIQAYYYPNADGGPYTTILGVDEGNHAFLSLEIQGEFNETTYDFGVGGWWSGIQMTYGNIDTGIPYVALQGVMTFQVLSTSRVEATFTNLSAVNIDDDNDSVILNEGTVKVSIKTIM